MEKFYEVRIEEGRDARSAYLKVDGDGLVSLFRLGNANVRVLSGEEMDRVLRPQPTPTSIPTATGTPADGIGKIVEHRVYRGSNFQL